MVNVSCISLRILSVHSKGDSGRDLGREGKCTMFWTVVCECTDPQVEASLPPSPHLCFILQLLHKRSKPLVLLKPCCLVNTPLPLIGSMQDFKYKGVSWNKVTNTLIRRPLFWLTYIHDTWLADGTHQTACCWWSSICPIVAPSLVSWH